MIFRRIILSTVLAAGCCVTVSAADRYYTNPIIDADYSDPDVIAVGDDFYMTASSFNCVPGLPILHSRDLVNWTIVNHAIDRLVPEDFYAVPRHGKGVWAPSIRYHGGEYFIYWGDPDFGIFMVKSKDPLGQWSEPVLVKEGKGMIDPTPLWDEDGKAYMVHAWAASRSRFNSVLTVWEMTPDGTALTGDPVMVFDGNDEVNHTVEGPKFYKRDGWYYILAPAGGVVSGWQLAMRSRSPFGPYESRIVMAQGGTDINGPHQGGLVDTPAGESWFINFQDKGLYGRVLHLNPVSWVDGWPVIGVDKDGDGCGEPVKRYRMPAMDGDGSPGYRMADTDDFNTCELGKQWQWNANRRADFGFTTNMGFMRLYGYELSPDYVNFWEVPNLLLQKFPADEFTATAKVRAGAKTDGPQSGLIVMGHDYARLGVEKVPDGFAIVYTECKDAEHGGAETRTVIKGVRPTRSYDAGLIPNHECELWLRVKVAAGGECEFSYSMDGRRYTGLDMPRFQAREGKWIGAKIGLYSVQPSGIDKGWMDIDSFIIEK